jgi:hydroxymethylbilane synthase
MGSVPERSLRIATRGSRLALWQAEHVAARLRAAFAGTFVETVVVKTTGDRVLDTPLSKIGDKGLFTKELEAALLDGRADVAVHSLKDLPTRLPAGLEVAAVLEREDPRDALLTLNGSSLAGLAPGARVGTSSLRRRAQLLARRPDLHLEDLRGNVDTRIGRLERGELDGLVLALAGVRRLGLERFVSERLAPETLLPPPGQGAVAVEARADDSATLAKLAALDHRPTRLATTAERALLARLEGGCQVPIGALARLDGGRLSLRALVSDLLGHSVLTVEGDVALPEGAAEQALEEANELGRAMADHLLGAGAGAILSGIERKGVSA